MLQIFERFGKRLFLRPMFFEVAMHELCTSNATAVGILGISLLEMESEQMMLKCIHHVQLR
jgi:hypothetical protein